MRADVQCRVERRQRPADPEELPFTQSATGIPAHHDDTGNTGWFGSRQSDSDTPFYNGLSGRGSGFGYYSLSSIFITEYKGAELGTIALLANISREILTLLAAPLLVRWFGNLAPISAGGATTMDTTLPIITRTAGQQFVVVSIFHGFVVDFSVPFLVTLFCSI